MHGVTLKHCGNGGSGGRVLALLDNDRHSCEGIVIPANQQSFKRSNRHSHKPTVIPAQAGIQVRRETLGFEKTWIPAYAGMTEC